MTPEDYVRGELESGRLTAHHIVVLTREYQLDNGLDVDGKPGPATRAALDFVQRPDTRETGFKFKCPLHPLKDGRKAMVTSGYREADRPDHGGLDLFYPFKAGDKPDFVGDKGAAGKKGPDGKMIPLWVVPYDQFAWAGAAGTVQMAANSPTGYRVWIDHGNGWRTGYFHLLDLKVHVGDKVTIATPLGLVGDSPRGDDGRHLHLELSPADRYAPVNPLPYMVF